MSEKIVILKNKIEDVKCFLSSLKIEKDFNLEEIRSKISEIIFLGGYEKPYRIHYFNKEGLYRARKHRENENLFKWTHDFWYRDWAREDKSDWRYDRLNSLGESVWYFSNSLKACIAEIRPFKNDLISVANIKQFTDKKFDCFLHMGSTFLRQDDIGLDRIYAEEEKYKDVSDLEEKKTKLIDDFFDEILLREVSDEERFKYIPSIALSEIFKISKNGSKTNGIFYPSIALGKDATNVALLHPKSDETNFFVDRVIQFKVVYAKEDRYYEVMPLQMGENFTTNQSGNFPIAWRDPTSEEILAYNYKIEIRSTLCPS